MANTDPKYISNFVAQNTYLKPEEKQQLLEELRPSRRLARLDVYKRQASILAKVTRDRYMCALAEKYPGYGFETHKGYGTKSQMCIRDRGPEARRRWSCRR